jgi:cytosine/adenosine deaminase-related metal-dependent hydrolase
LQEGAAADCLVLDVDELAAQEDVYLDRLVFADLGLRHVWRGGRRVVVDGEHVARAAVKARYRAAQGRLLG